MSDSGRFERRLVQAWQALSPRDDLKERVRTQVLAAAADGGTAGNAGAADVQHTGVRLTSSRWRALRASGRVGAGVGAMLVGLGFVAGYWSTHSTETHEARAVNAASTLVTQRETAVPESASPAVASVTSSAPAESHTPAPARWRGRRMRADVVAAPDVAELELLQRAERALRARQPELALALTRELGSRFPRSALHEERQAMQLMAHCQLQDRESAAAQRRFSRRYPGSVYIDRVKAECEAPPAAPTLTNPEAPDMDEAKE